MKLIASLLLGSLMLLTGAPLQVERLFTDFQSNAVEASTAPRLGWALKSDERGAQQATYQILAASSLDQLNEADADLWKVMPERSGQRSQIPWQGQPLKPGQAVFWKVRVQNKDKEFSPWSEPAKFTASDSPKLAPAKVIASFQSDSDALNALFQESLKTLTPRLQKAIDGDLAALGNGDELHRTARSYLYLFEAHAPLTAWMKAVDAAMTKDDFLPIAPGSQVTRSVASEGGIIAHHPLWWMTGDEAYPAERWKIYERHMISRENMDRAFAGTAWGGLEATEGMPAEFVDLCYLGFTTRLVRELALPAKQPLNVIRFQDYAARIRKGFEKRFVADDGTLKVKSQSAHALALRCAVLKPEQQQKVVANLITSLKKDGLKVGPIGAHFLPGVLTLTENHDLALELLSELKPEDRALFAQNGIAEWLMSYIGGIDASLAGFGQIRIAPRVTSSGPTSVTASYQSPVGTIKSAWKKSTNEGVIYTVTIPTGTIARIMLPAQKDQTITEGGKTIEEATHIAQAGRSDQGVTLIAQSGTYQIQVK